MIHIVTIAFSGVQNVYYVVYDGFETTDPFDGCRVPGSKVFVPTRIELDDGRLVFDLAKRKEGEQNRIQNAGALGRFLHLAQGRDEEVKAFASLWGVLDLCKHQLPFTHAREDLISRDPFWETICPPVGGERIRSWKMIAKRFSEILDDSVSLRSHPPRARASIDSRWRDLHDRVRQWFNYSGVSVAMPEIQRPGKADRSLGLGIQCLGLYDVLAVQLWMAVLQVSQLLVCSECAKVFGSRAPRRPGERTFCLECSAKGAPEQHAARDLRMRKTSCFRLARKGLSAEQIAQQLNAKLTTIQRWLKQPR
jgi:hypothetical protein